MNNRKDQDIERITIKMKIKEIEEENMEDFLPVVKRKDSYDLEYDKGKEKKIKKKREKKKLNFDNPSKAKGN